MLRRHRARRGPYSMATPSVVPSIIRSVLLLALLGILLYGTTKGVLWLFGGSSRSQTPAQLTVEQGGTVNVSIDDQLLQRTEDSMKLYEGDRIVTSANGFATISFFDKTVTRLDAQTDIRLTTSNASDEDPAWALKAEKGAVWVHTPTMQTYSGSITRTITMPRYEATLTSDTEAVIEESTLMVFSADGAGVQVKLADYADPIIVGEGQQFTLPEGEIGNDPYVYRSAIEPLAVQRAFITKSRTMFTTSTPSTDTESGTTIDTVKEVLTITSPTEGTTVTTATVKVTGSVGSTVDRVRINGFDATLASDRSFSQELSLQDAASTILLIEAFDARGLSLAQRSITVFKGSASIPAPTITSPAADGQTYRTQKSELSISGTTSANTVGMMVNDYRLQLFRKGDTTWSYLASKALGNLKDGTNVFTVVTIDAAGNRSAPATLTIIVDTQATEGVVGGAATSSTATAPVVQESELPKNDPLMPGTVSVTGPVAGVQYTATGSEFLLEGATPRETVSVWVNGYKLQLYKPGATFWNYIAKVDFGTLKAGKNVYKIVARDASNKILDMFEYTVTYQP